MISWHNAPEYSHKGYIYRPEIEHEDEEGIRKATHRCVSRIDPLDVMIAPHFLKPLNQPQGYSYKRSLMPPLSK